MEIIQALLKWDEIIYAYITKTLYDSLLFFFFQIITNFVDVIIFALALFLLFFGIWKIRTSKLSKMTFDILVPVAITTFATILLKVIFHRGAPIPYVIPWLEIKVPFAFQYAFPSGHTSRAFAFVTALAIKIPNKIFILFLIAALIGFSRIYIGAHYPLDVVAGAVLGVTITLLYDKVDKKIAKKTG